MGKKICFTIHDAKYHVALQDHTLAEKLLAMCPFEADYSCNGSHEYYAALPSKVSSGRCPLTTQGHKNGLYYFEGWNALSIAIEDCNTAPYPIYHVGNFENQNPRLC